MQSKQAPRATGNQFARRGFKVLFGLFLLPAFLISAGAISDHGGTTSGNGNGTWISVSPNQLVIGTVSVAYSTRLNPQGGTAPYRYAFVRGAIPPGLYFNTATGTVAGTPTTAGSFSFRVAISDADADHNEVTVYVIVKPGSATTPAITVAVTPGSVSVPSAGTQQFSATVVNTSNTAVTWSASNGTISRTGMFTAPSVTAAATATVTATSVADPSKHSQSTIAVTPAAVAVSVAVSPISSSIISAGTQQFTATVRNTSNTVVQWSASGGTISGSGMFTAPSVTSSTTATITATSVADATKFARSTVTINPATAAPVSVIVSPASSSVVSAGTQQFVASVSNTANTGVTWSSSGGTISANGMFTAPSVTSSTTATVAATSVADPTKSARSTVTINPATAAAVSVTVSPASSSVVSAGTQQFVASVNNTANTRVTWSSSGGTISANGVFTAPSVTSSTTATVAATSVADPTKSALATIFVTPQVQGPPPPPPPPSTGADNTYCGTGDLANFGGSDTVATLPQACINTALANTPSPGKVTLVAAGGNVQSAINAAACGDTIQLQAGATFNGTFLLPNKTCDGQHWITIRTSAPDSSLPPEGTRLTPCSAGVASLPGRPVYYCPSPSNVMPKVLAAGNQTFMTQPGAGYYRFIGLEISNPPGMITGQPDTLVAITDGTQLPHHVIIDRCWIHGLPGTYAKRGVKLDGQYLAVIDSTITDIHIVGTDNQGIAAGTGTGPLKIVDNFIEGGSDSILFGGQGNPFGNPQDVEIRRNHMFKPLSQMAGSASWDGQNWDDKVALESKNSNRVLVEGNILENAWGDVAGGAVQGGDGGLVWLGPKSQNSACPTCDVSDITFRYNLLRHAGGGTYVFDAPADTGATALQAMRYSIHDNVMDDITTTWSRNGSGNGDLHRFFGTSTYLPPRDVEVFHNTGLSNGSAFLSLAGGTATPYVNFSFANNLEINGAYGLMGCASRFGTPVLTACAPGYTFAGNVIVGGKSTITAGAWMPAAAPAVGFVNFNNGNGGDYRLCQGPGNPVSSCTAASPYVNAGTDGRDVGADMTTLNSLISGVN